MHEKGIGKVLVLQQSFFVSHHLHDGIDVRCFYHKWLARLDKDLSEISTIDHHLVSLIKATEHKLDGAHSESVPLLDSIKDLLNKSLCLFSSQLSELFHVLLKLLDVNPL